MTFSVINVAKLLKEYLKIRKKCVHKKKNSVGKERKCVDKKIDLGEVMDRLLVCFDDAVDIFVKECSQDMTRIHIEDYIVNFIKLNRGIQDAQRNT